MPKRKIEELDVHFISLVKSPANQKRLILKSDGNAEVYVAIQKTDPVKQIAYGIVYPPDEADTQGDSMTAEEIEKAAYAFMRKSRTENIDAEHDFEKRAGCWVCESWIVKTGDPMFSEAGAWAIGVKIDNADEWAALTKGDYTGFSLAGEGFRRVEKTELVAGINTQIDDLKALVKSLADRFAPKEKEPVEKDGYGDFRRMLDQTEGLLERLRNWSDEIQKTDPALKGQIEAMETALQARLDDIANRVAIIEKATPESPQQPGADQPVPKESMFKSMFYRLSQQMEA